jgi:regulator of cell morphogenesis and NO signaling
MQELADATTNPQHDDWSRRTLADLQRHLVERYHVHARVELHDLGTLADKVASEHGSRHTELLEVAKLAAALAEDMLPHMLKEERVLFPYVEQLEFADEPGPSCFGTVENPIRVMRMEHEAVEDLLRSLRLVTGDYAAPDDASGSWRELYARLAAFEAETRQHIHLENNVHFPRALALELAAV